MPQSIQILVELVLWPLTLAGGAFGPIIAKLIFLLQKICKPNSSVKCLFYEIVSFKAIFFLVSVLLRSLTGFVLGRPEFAILGYVCE